MKKPIILICVVAFLITLWVIIRVTGIINTYKVASSANEPNLVLGQLIVTSNLKMPKLFDFITIKKDEELIIYRICGISGDKVEIRNGQLLINDKMAFENFETKHPYILSKTEFNKIVNLEINLDNYTRVNDTTYNVNLENSLAKKLNFENKREVTKLAEENEQISDLWGKKYNADHFGPVIVPKDNYFVLGDNRSNAADSRYIGFINKKDASSTLL
ncbi:signal peptidase I [Pedobacter frigiditerrae]|uniref:signal peptidase I n=1 Tax=Pedobacter frigiditerrae TaxID=2530452 RepID=UPI00292D4DA6|nr:signal peptidase I [Pedobacter frigiditerrae]